MKEQKTAVIDDIKHPLKEDNFVNISDDEGKINCRLPVIKSSDGPDVIDCRSLYQKTGVFSYDPGFLSTASCSSSITFTDGNKGILRYRGYSIEELANYSDYMEVCYLLLNGELPNKYEKAKFLSIITKHTMVHEQINTFFRGFRRDAHPMAIMVGIVGALSAFYTDKEHNFSSPEGIWVAVSRIIAKMPTIAAMAYKYSIGQPFMYPRNDLSYAANFLYMLFANPCEEYVPIDIHVKAMDQLLILHADHEQNASTSTVRLAGSSGANPFACIASGIASLWGPAHGGANEAVLRMLKEIGHKGRIKEYIKRAQDHDDPFLLMGFGHRVYKNRDPRGEVVRKVCLEVVKGASAKKQDPLLDLACELERIALEDEYFITRKLYPNIDFYSGILLRALGLPVSMFTVFFAVARTIGWIAQWKEMSEDQDLKIGRPRQLYTGEKLRNFVPLESRTKKSRNSYPGIIRKLDL